MNEVKSNRAWRLECEQLRIEVERLKTVPMKYRRMQFNAELQMEADRLRSHLAVAVEALERIRQWDALDIPNSDGNFWKGQIDEALATIKGDEG